MIRIIAVFLLPFLGCNNNENPADTSPADSSLPIEQWGTVVFIDSVDVEQLPTDPFDLNAAAIAGDTLAVEVSYSGGCAGHDLILVLANSFADSVLQVELAHNANRDSCEAWLTEEHLFNLTPIRNRFGEGSSGRIVLQLAGAGELRYTFPVAPDGS